MQLVIRDGKVLATHDDGQDVAGKYPGCEVVTFAREFTMPVDGVLDGFPDDPRTEEEKALAYRDRRRLAYPSIADQLDMLYWDQVLGTSRWKDSIGAVKEQYPVEPADPALCAARVAKLEEVAGWREGRLAQGFDTGLGFALKIGDTDQHTFAAYKVMLDAALQANAKTTSSVVVVGDVAGELHSITVAQFYGFILVYGSYCETFFQEYQGLLSSVWAASTAEEVEAVVVGS